MPVRILWDSVGNVVTFDVVPVQLAGQVSERACHQKPGKFSPWMPVADVYETETELILHVELAGIDRNSLHIVFEQGQLVLQGIRPFHKQGGPVKIHRVERLYGEFYRIFQIPVPIEAQAITASYGYGILTIVLPKQQRRNAEPIKIPITCTQD